MNRFSKDNWPPNKDFIKESQGLGDPPWIGDPDYGRTPYNEESELGNFHNRLDQLAQHLGTDLAETWWQEHGSLTPQPLEQDSDQKATLAEQEWAQRWYQEYGDKYIDEWIEQNHGRTFEEYSEDLADEAYEFIRDQGAKPAFDQWYPQAARQYFQF